MVDFEHNQERRDRHWKHFVDDFEMPEGFSDSSYSNDTFPTIMHDSCRIMVWFQDIDGWIGDLDGKEEDMPKYSVTYHETENIYEYDWDGKDSRYKWVNSNDWNKVLEVIEEWRKTQ